MPRPPSTAATIVAKLSSVRIMSPASFVTSVPVIPIATPMSARLSAGASLTPSPVIATTLPLRFSMLDEAHLVLRRDARDDADPVDLVLELVVAQRRELGARQSAPLDPELGGDRRGGRGVVAGDHAHADPRLLAAGDRVPRLLARRVDDPDEGEQRQPLHLVEQRAVRVERRRVDVARGDGQHAEALASEAVVLGEDALAAALRAARSTRRRRGSAPSARAGRRARP